LQSIIKKFSDNFSISVGYNVTFLKNEVLEVNNGTGYIEGGAFGGTTSTFKNGSRNQWDILWLQN
jgi:hypothetical protein